MAPSGIKQQMVLKGDQIQSYNASGILSNTKCLYLGICTTDLRPGFRAADSQFLCNVPGPRMLLKRGMILDRTGAHNDSLGVLAKSV